MGIEDDFDKEAAFVHDSLWHVQTVFNRPYVDVQKLLKASQLNIGARR